MVFVALFSSVLLATTALARPSLSDRVERRGERAHQSRPRNSTQGHVSDVSNVEYSSNWAGAVFDSAKGSYSAVTATFIVPTPKTAGSGSSYSASAWVGIDGDTCGTAILQTGVDFTVSKSGSVSYDAWYEWYPDYAYDFSGIPIKAGDEIKLTVTAKTTKSGSAVIQNLTTGKSVTKSLTSTAALCEQNAEWIVEDYEEGSSLVPFANFGTVVFSNAVATSPSGATTGPSGSTLIDIKSSSGTVLTSVSTSSSSVTVSYV